MAAAGTAPASPSMNAASGSMWSRLRVTPGASTEPDAVPLPAGSSPSFSSMSTRIAPMSPSVNTNPLSPTGISLGSPMTSPMGRAPTFYDTRVEVEAA